MWFALYNCLDLLRRLDNPFASNWLTLRFNGIHSPLRNIAIHYNLRGDVLMQKLEGVVNSWEEPHYHLALKTMRAREYPLRRGITRR